MIYYFEQQQFSFQKIFSIGLIGYQNGTDMINMSIHVKFQLLETCNRN